MNIGVLRSLEVTTGGEAAAAPALGPSPTWNSRPLSPLAQAPASPSARGASLPVISIQEHLLQGPDATVTAPPWGEGRAGRAKSPRPCQGWAPLGHFDQPLTGPGSLRLDGCQAQLTVSDLQLPKPVVLKVWSLWSLHQQHQHH